MIAEIILTLWLCYFVLFLVSLKIKDNSIVDVFWGTGFLIFAGILFFSQEIINIYEIIFFTVIFVFFQVHLLNQAIVIRAEIT